MKVLFFAQLKDVTKCDSVELNSPAPITVEQLWTKLFEQFPALTVHRTSVRLAKNMEYVSTETELSNTDEVALIPPVSGG